MKTLIKLSIALTLLAGFIGSSLNTNAYPPFLKKATKFGAKDCLYCHKNAEGGEGWNERGTWLMAEKDRRKAEAIDVEWLAEYKEGDNKEGETKEGDKKEGEKENKESKEDSKSKDDLKKEDPKKKEKP